MLRIALASLFLSAASLAAPSTAAAFDVRSMVAGVVSDRCLASERCSTLVRQGTPQRRGSHAQWSRAIVERYGVRLVNGCMSSLRCQAYMTEIVRRGSLRDMDVLFERVALEF